MKKYLGHNGLGYLKLSVIPPSHLGKPLNSTSIKRGFELQPAGSNLGREKGFFLWDFLISPNSTWMFFFFPNSFSIAFASSFHFFLWVLPWQLLLALGWELLEWNKTYLFPINSPSCHTAPWNPNVGRRWDIKQSCLWSLIFCNFSPKGKNIKQTVTLMSKESLSFIEAHSLLNLPWFGDLSFPQVCVGFSLGKKIQKKGGGSQQKTDKIWFKANLPDY